jgi:hypothetical protein
MKYGVELEATLLITCSHGGDDDKLMHLVVTDEISGCRVCELYMRLDEFAKALMSSQGKATMEYFPKAPIGMKAENKTELVPFDMYKSGRSEKAITEALRPFEIDGWVARRSDMTNGHYQVKGGQRVVFFRHVNPETGAPITKQLEDQ